MRTSYENTKNFAALDTLYTVYSFLHQQKVEISTYKKVIDFVKNGDSLMQEFSIED